MGESQEFPKALVAVVTYRRPESLRRLLQSLLLSDYPSFDVLVVDNDAMGSASDVTKQMSVSYKNEPRPGIAAARNSALTAARVSDSDWLVFVDDDEVVGPDWLRKLLTQESDVVVGGVDPVFPRGAKDWYSKSGLYRVVPGGLGQHARWPATNNVAIKLSFLRRNLDLQFAPELGLVGGSDVDFFMRAQKLGALQTWEPGAPVLEHVEPSRLSLTWLMFRGMRLGASLAICERRNYGRGIVGRRIGRATANFLIGWIQTVCCLVTFQRAGLARGIFRMFRGVGGLLGLAGYTPAEYRRDGRSRLRLERVR